MLLVAPAGYGKTTLARQWLTQAGHQVSWLTASPGSADVAELATALVAVAASESADRELKRQLKSLTEPSQRAEEIAATVARAFLRWPKERWLVIDDYDFVSASGTAELFLESVFGTSNVQVVVCARRRPQWASARRVLYGDICEIGMAELALTEEETAAVIGAPADGVAPLWGRTRGWPAVIRLAALSGSVSFPPETLTPALHEYFAEELFRAATLEVQQGLIRLATLPTLTPSLTRLALGATTDAITDQAVELGFLTRAPGGLLELHPLLRTFLGEKLATIDQPAFLEELTKGVIDEGRWDDAFAMITRFSQLQLLEPMIAAALDPLLEGGRIATLQSWVEWAIVQGCESPLLLLAEAEVSRSKGRSDVGEARALQAARLMVEDDGLWLSRAYAVAGECAHTDYRAADALRHHELAERYAKTQRDARRSSWGRFISSVNAAPDELRELLERFESLSDGRPSTTLRIATGRMVLAMMGGGLEYALRGEQAHVELVQRTDDPVVASSFMYRIAYTQTLVANYADGLALAKRGDELTRSAGLDFALPHFAAALTAAMIGLRQFKRAEALRTRLLDLSDQHGDDFERANASALLARIQLARSAYEEAAETVSLWEAVKATADMRLECAALLAIAHAATGQNRHARTLADVVLANARDVQPLTLANLALAICEMQSPTRDFSDQLMRAEDIVCERQNFDSLVCAYRAHHPLLKLLHDRERIPPSVLQRIVINARDQPIANRIGWTIESRSPLTSLLSPREREVYDLLCKGLTNREIAQTLVISEVTAKVHVRHILEKLGVRSRTEAALLAYETA